MRVPRPTLLMTRPLVASQRFVANLNPDLTKQCDVITSPLIRIENLSEAFDLHGVAGVIFTSAHAVQAVRNAGHQSQCPAFCVGQATARAASDAGWQSHQIGEDAASLIVSLVKRHPDGPLLHIRGAHARGDIAKSLTEQGLPCFEVVVYTQTAQPFSDDAVTAMQGNGPIIAPLFSPRTALLFRQGAIERPFHIVAMSAAVADELRDLPHVSITTARAPSAHEMGVLVENVLQSHVPG